MQYLPSYLGVLLCLVHYRCHSVREEKRKKEEEEEKARRRAEEEERKKREEEEEARRKAEEEALMRIEEEARRRAEEEAARRAQEQREKEEQRGAHEPQTREDPDIELVTEEMLDENLFVPEEEEDEEERREDAQEDKTSLHIDEEQGKDEELEEEELDLETSGTFKAEPQQDEEEEEEEDLKNQTPGRPDSESVLPSGLLIPNALKSTSDKMTGTASTSPQAAQKSVQPVLNKPSSSIKREERRRRGLEHNKRQTERVAVSCPAAVSSDQTSPPRSKNQETAKLKERSDSKELDQYTFVAWKMKDDKGGKKDARSSPPPAGPVRPSTLPLLPLDSAHEKNGDGTGAVNLQRRTGAIKEKPEKWKGRRSNGENSKTTGSPPLSNREERMKSQLYV